MGLSSTIPVKQHTWLAEKMKEEECRILFGKHIAQLRKDKGLSQDKLAWHGEMSRSFIGEVERGLRNPTLSNICKLADALGVKKADLFDLIDKGTG
jgi:transcriptional regulator with XRE-family HTH domain